MAAHVPGQFKVTMMSAAMGAMTWQPGVSDAAYPDPAELVNDLVALQVAEVAELASLGRALGPARLAVLQPGVRRRVPRGDAEPDRPARHPRRSVAADTAIVSGRQGGEPRCHRGHAHLPRQQPLRLHGQGRLRAGRGAALRHVPRRPVPARVRRRAVRRVRAAALRRGPARSSCSGWSPPRPPVLESQDDLRRRIDEAARYVPLENLALQPAVRLRLHLGGQRADPRTSRRPSWSSSSTPRRRSGARR